MKVLILGGTGAMGMPLQQKLLDLGYDVHVTSRSNHSREGITYHIGNAHDMSFMSEVLNTHYDVIIDFMSYSTEEFTFRISKLLSNTSQYVFTSSSRVYAPCDSKITERHPRLLDVCEDSEYLRTDEYALSKARQENLILNSNKDNWTIIRPSLTYNSNRLQYALGEKEEWLYRYLNGEKIVFPENMNSIITTMSWGEDVANAISLLVGNKRAIGETVHIAGSKPITWGEINKIYSNVLLEVFHQEMNIVYIPTWIKTSKVLNKYYQIKYARGISRQFDNSKLESLIGNIVFTEPTTGLVECLKAFLNSERKFNRISWKTEAYYNKITKDKNTQFAGKERIKYTIGRYTPYFSVRS